MLAKKQKKILHSRIRENKKKLKSKLQNIEIYDYVISICYIQIIKDEKTKIFDINRKNIIPRVLNMLNQGKHKRKKFKWNSESSKFYLLLINAKNKTNRKLVEM